MSANVTTAEMRRELQQLLSEERDLVDQAVNATASGQYVRLRDTSEQLVKVSERRDLLRVALIKARAQEAAEQAQETVRHGATDQSKDTWRLLR